MKRRIVLFDIDGTLLTFEGQPPGPGRTALDRAMRELHGVDGATEGMRVAGGTDLALAREMLTRAGLQANDEAIARLLSAYLEELRLVLESRRYRPVGDVAVCLDRLRARGAIVGLATGNLREGAGYKLASAGLRALFDLDRGAYGSDAEVRADIVRMAARRCGATPADEIVVVGDTEFDVRAGRAMGARVVGVAVSENARAELLEAGADAIVEACGEELARAVAEV
jgi:phosphoglycolate phosphatase-like HAD superfamily hydrolase